jgi:hypothetical protein
MWLEQPQSGWTAFTVEVELRPSRLKSSSRLRHGSLLGATCRPNGPEHDRVGCGSASALNTILVEQDHRPRKERLQPKIERFEWAVRRAAAWNGREKVQEKKGQFRIEELGGNLADHSGSRRHPLTDKTYQKEIAPETEKAGDAFRLMAIKGFERLPTRPTRRDRRPTFEAHHP